MSIVFDERVERVITCLFACPPREILLEKLHYILYTSPTPKTDLIKKISPRVQKIVDITNQILVQRTPLLIGGLSKTG
jgi:hypothetical protein